MIGRTLGHYRVDAELGAGAMGIVYRAFDEKLQRAVAVKLLNAGAPHAGRAQLLAEARAASALNHPGICTIHEVDDVATPPFIVMELVEGRALRDAIPPGGMPAESVSRYGAQVADALQHAHDHGIVHRDLKSANVMLTPEGRVKVLDFGLARRLGSDEIAELTRSRTVAEESATVSGTLAYMAPEVLRGEPPDPRADIWALGVMLHEMATARRPFAGRTPFELTASVLHDPVPPLPEGLPPALRRVIETCLEKDPRARFAHASDVCAALEPTTEATPPVGGRRWIVAGASVLALVALAVGLADRGRLPRGERAADSEGLGGAVLKPRRSVAVLGFRSLSGRAEDAWLSTALSEMLVTELAAGGTLRTIPGENVARMKADLALPDAESYAKDTLARIRANVGSDLVVLGSYLTIPEAGGRFRLDLRLQDAMAGETVAAISEGGTVSELFDVVSRAGRKMREELGVGDVSRGQAAEVRASLPAGPEATRLYSEGLASLRRFDALRARDLLERAVAADDSHAAAHAALAAAWQSLGYDGKAKEAAKRAFDRSRRLPREQRLSIEARWWEANAEWDRAAEIMRGLFDRYPDNLEYGLRLAELETQAGRGADALVTLEAVRRVPSPSGDDPRIDLAEAASARSLSDFERQRAAAQRAAEKGERAGARLLVARARLAEGRALQSLGNREGALESFEEAQRRYAAAGERSGAAEAVNSRAIVMAIGGDLDAARGFFQEALATWREIGNKNGVASSLNNIAIGYLNQGDLGRARQFFEESLALRREIADKRGTSGVLHNIAHLHAEAGEFSQARRVGAEALALRREVGEKSGVAVSLNFLGTTAYDMGDLEEPAHRYEEALALYREIGEKSGVARVLHNRGLLRHARGDLEGATQDLKESLAMRRELRERSGIAQNLFSLAEVLVAQDRLEEAKEKYAEARALRDDIGETSKVSGGLVEDAFVALEEDRVQEATASARQAEAAFRALGRRNGEATALAMLARCLVAKGDVAGARRAIERAQELSARSEEAAVVLNVTLAAARVDAASGRTARAAVVLDGALARAAASGCVPFEYDARLALVELSMATAPRWTAERLAALEKDARRTGFLRVARKAAELRKATPT